MHALANLVVWKKYHFFAKNCQNLQKSAKWGQKSVEKNTFREALGKTPVGTCSYICHTELHAKNWENRMGQLKYRWNIEEIWLKDLRKRGPPTGPSPCGPKGLGDALDHLALEAAVIVGRWYTEGISEEHVVFLHLYFTFLEKKFFFYSKKLCFNQLYDIVIFSQGTIRGCCAFHTFHVQQHGLRRGLLTRCNADSHEITDFFLVSYSTFASNASERCKCTDKFLVEYPLYCSSCALRFVSWKEEWFLSL